MANVEYNFHRFLQYIEEINTYSVQFRPHAGLIALSAVFVK